jgi:hypothetical protein
VIVCIAADLHVSISTVEHAGFHDQEYRQRRDELAALASSYKHGQPIPYVQYTDTENKTWYETILIYHVVYSELRCVCRGEVFTGLSEIHATHACDEYIAGFKLLIGMSPVCSN